MLDKLVYYMNYDIPASCSFRKGSELYPENPGSFLMYYNSDREYTLSNSGTLLIGNIFLNLGYIPIDMIVKLAHDYTRCIIVNRFFYEDLIEQYLVYRKLKDFDILYLSRSLMMEYLLDKEL